MREANNAAISLAADHARLAAQRAINDDLNGLDSSAYVGPYTWIYLRVREALNAARRDVMEDYER